MRRGSNNLFATARVEGGVLPIDLLRRVSDGDKSLGGLNPADYHLIESEKLNEATNRSWNRMLGAWATLKAGMAKMPDADPKTSLTRERWLLPLFQELGYGRLATARAVEIDNKSFAVSHVWSGTPIHLVGCGIDLDTRSEGVAGAARMTPHGLVQELLNRSEDYLWGFVSNGLRLRILRDNFSLTRQAFVEFDLEAMMEGEAYSDFVLLWLLCHQSRVEAEKLEECWLEKWSKAAQEQGTRALDQLRDGVTSAIAALGSGFVSHSANRELKERLRSGTLDKQDYYRELLRLVYRLLFIFVAEDRDLLLMPVADRQTRERYTKYYSTSRVRRMAGRKRGTNHPDLYYSMRLVMQKLGSDGGCPKLGLPALGSFLFSPEATEDIENCEIANADFLNAIRALAYTIDGEALRPVDYKNLGSEELGSVYESLLELHPELNLDAGIFELRTAAGNERKTTGSYYTPTGLIQCLLDSALDPVLDEAVKKPEPEKALLDLKICDPACGSGHFLIAAAHRLAKRVAIVRTGDIEPSPDAVRAALRQVISKCIYGVDINPMSVELCKLALWMEAIDPGKPLSFLDHHIQCGNSLIGATPRLLKEGIPDAAFDPIEGDDKAICSGYRKRNKKEREGQGTLFSHDLQPWEQLGNLVSAMMNIDSDDDGSIDAEHRKQERYEKLVHSTDYEFGRLLADAWCAAFMWKKTREFDYPITEEVFRRIERTPHACPDFMRTEIERLAKQHQFFHWHLAFPNVFRLPGKEEPENEQTGWIGGFDCVLGNPPWERIKLQEDEFFASRAPEIVRAKNKAARQRLISRLSESDPALLSLFGEARRGTKSVSRFLRESNRYPLAGCGDVNTYAVFAELAYQLQNPHGRAGIIVPTAIATGDTTKLFFDHISCSGYLASLLDFLEARDFFIGLESRDPFCLLTLRGQRSVSARPAEFVFRMLNTTERLERARRVVLSPADFTLFNPNTRTCPTFRTQVDAALMRSIYERVPVLDNAVIDSNTWGVSFQAMFHMANSSGLFQDEHGSSLLPLYEAKMMHLFDHRWATYEGASERDRRNGLTKGFPLDQKLVAHSRVQPRYWVQPSEVGERLDNRWTRDWVIGWRSTGRINDRRTLLAAIMPLVGCGDTILLMYPSQGDSTHAGCLMSNLGSCIADYVVRQKVGGGSIKYFIMRQLPILPPTAYSSANMHLILPRLVELTYNAWDIKAFADDVWREGDDALRQAIARQWEENCAATGGHAWDPPEWAEMDEGGITLPPFKWNEDRRAVLRAELDAYYAKLYGLNRKQLRYVLDPRGLSETELEDILDPREDPTCSGSHLLPAEPALDFPGETFRVLKNKEDKEFGEYRTRRLVIEAWERLHAQGLMPEAYDQAAVSEQTQERIPMPAEPVAATEDDQVFPWPGREAFVYESIPQLIPLRSGESFEFYRYAAIIASRPDHLRQLLELSGNRDHLTRLDSISSSIQEFAEEQRIRPRQIRESLTTKELVEIRDGIAYLPSQNKVNAPDDLRRQMLELALIAADVFYAEKQKATPSSQLRVIEQSLEQVAA